MSTSLIIITIVIKLVGRICACSTAALTTRRGTLQAMFAAGRQGHLALQQSLMSSTMELRMKVEHLSLLLKCRELAYFVNAAALPVL